jgi:hypothetical protein
MWSEKKKEERALQNYYRSDQWKEGKVTKMKTRLHRVEDPTEDSGQTIVWYSD